MDLERRVQALEQELEILKNQIQATLLDIQEQMLSNAHPTLHTEQQPQQSETPGPVQTVSLAAIDPSPTQPSRPKRDLPDWTSISAMERWVQRKVDQYGVERTRALIHMYGEQGQLPNEAQTALMRLVYLQQSQQPAHQPNAAVKVKPVSVAPKAKFSPPSAPEPKPAPARASKPKPEHANDKSNVVLRLIAGLQNAGAGVIWRRDNG